VLQRVAVCCSVASQVALYLLHYGVLQRVSVYCGVTFKVAPYLLCYGMVQHVAVCCIVLQCVAMCGSVWRRVAMGCSAAV